MSVPPKGEELPKKGGKLPAQRTRQKQAQEFTEAISDALKEELARGSSIKTIMSWTGAGERTVKEWLAGSNAPRAFQLESLFRSSGAVYQRIMLRTGRQPVVTRHKLEAVRGQLSGLAEALDAALAEHEKVADSARL
jgi:hypothetical protein